MVDCAVLDFVLSFLVVACGCLWLPVVVIAVNEPMAMLLAEKGGNIMDVHRYMMSAKGKRNWVAGSVLAKYGKALQRPVFSCTTFTVPIAPRRLCPVSIPIPSVCEHAEATVHGAVRQGWVRGTR